MPASSTPVARQYHEATKHSPASVWGSAHYLDWKNQPAAFKSYAGLDPIPLPTGLPQTGIPAMEVLQAAYSPSPGSSAPSLEHIAYLLYHAAGITKKLIHPHGEIHFRAAACAGALYPIETYLVCGDITGLKAGVYHFNPGDFALRRLREGDHRDALMRASGDEPGLREAVAALVFTAITWRSSWKYQARAYRYHYWDCGTILANLLAACTAQQLPAKLVMGFVDDHVNSLIGVDGRLEKALCLVPIGRSSTAPPPVIGEPGGNIPSGRPLSEREVDYPVIDQLHRASALPDPTRVSQWRQGRHSIGSKEVKGRPHTLLEPLTLGDLPQISLEDVIVRRGSARGFKPQPISFAHLSTLLTTAMSDYPADWRQANDALTNDLYLNIHAVAGLDAGSYYHDPQRGRLSQLKPGNFRGDSAHLCLGQELGGASSFTLFFLADLEAILGTYGERGYRMVQLEAGLLGGRLYLGAYALGLGATGLTFFDDLTVDFFHPHAAGKDAIFVTACGKTARPPRRSGKLVYLAPGASIH